MNFTFEKTAGVSSTELKKQISTLKPFREMLKRVVDKHDQLAPESSILLPFLTESHKTILAMVKKYATKKLRCVVVIGIGGSNLGTKAVYDALRPFPSSKHVCELIFLETVSTVALLSTVDRLKSFKDPSAFLIVAISKSGGTTETMANLEALLPMLGLVSKIQKRCVVISDEGSRFWMAAKEKKIDCLAIPKMVGGRYSVFSAVGLFPLALVGIDIKKLLDGARVAVEDALSNDVVRNHSIMSACATYIQSKNQRTIHNSFFFAPELESLGKWYRQLMGESIGKEKDLEGKIVHAGITPIVSIGSTDLHSMAQLYFGGPDDKFTNIISAPSLPPLLRGGERLQFRVDLPFRTWLNVLNQKHLTS